jgi:hypothetical protein
MRHRVLFLVLSTLGLALARCGNSDSGSDAGSDASPDVALDHASDVSSTDAASDAADAADAVDSGIPVVPLVTGTYAAGAVWGPAQNGSPPNYPGGLWGGQTCTFDTTGALLQISNSSWTLSTTGPIAELGADGIVGWGRWATGNSTMGGTTAIKQLHYIVGAQAPAETNIKASYTVFASTTPVAMGTATVLGSANGVTGTVTYSAGTVTYSLANIAVGGDTFSITGTSGLYATTGFLAGGTVTSSACDGGCVGNITNAPMAHGWFIGANGERAALEYGFTSPLGTVSGAVVLK